MTDSRLDRIAAVHRQLAEIEQVRGAVADGLRMRSTRGAGPSVAYSIRLDRGELMALERRALLIRMKPTVLARNLIRIGLSTPAEVDVAGAVERIALAVEELRALVGSSPMLPDFG